MSGQIKCSKCGVLFDKAINPRRKHDYYRTWQLCRDKINGIVPCKHRISAQSKPVEPEPEQTNWKAVVFGTKSNSKPVEPEFNETDSVESKKPTTEDESDPEYETPIKCLSGHVDNSINEPIISSDDDVEHKPISSADLQAGIESKHVITKPAFFEISDDKKELTVSEKLNKILNLLDATTIQVTKQADGYNTSTKYILEKINSNVIQAMTRSGTPDTNYNAYEIKVDKLATRINELETNLKLFISTTTASTTQLNQCVSESEDNLRQALHHIYSKI